METENENFDQLKKLLAIKKHEVPPPGYFNRLPGEIVSRIRAERASQNADALARLDAEAPWLMRLWRTLESKPMFAGAFGAAICAVALGAIFLAEKPAGPPDLASPRVGGKLPIVAATPTPVSANVGIAEQQGLMMATNTQQPTLFDLVAPPPTSPASTRP